jgi:AraC family transcriptional regulator
MSRKPLKMNTETRLDLRTSMANPFGLFKGEASVPLVGKLRTAELAFTRVGLAQDHQRLHVQMPEQDAYYLILQLRDCPPHDHWENSRYRPAPASQQGQVHIADLNASPSALLSDFDSLNFLLPRALLDELAEDAVAPRIGSLQVPSPWTTHDPVLSRLAPLLVSMLQDPASVSQLFIDHLTVATALHIAGQYGGLRPAILKPGGLAPWQENRAREMIATNLAKELPLLTVAAECGLSLSHFSKAFKASVGMTPHGWLQASRAAKARNLLHNPGVSLAEIALSCGFADQSHFTRIFKHATGFTPGAWRRLRLH